jgi:hypothetical protein
VTKIAAVVSQPQDYPLRRRKGVSYEAEKHAFCSKIRTDHAPVMYFCLICIRI